MEEESYRRSRLCRLLGNPVAFTVVQLLADNKELSPSEIARAVVDRQLRDEPTNETRNRKPMRPNPIAPWELRIGNLRVYYEVEEHPESKVVILAVGVKERNRVRIGKDVVEL
ncbi:MAG TPA: hypothetical protein VFM35_06685 [Candidatus Binatia bacterium]|nr:hypothetical protein [Candidatus Binatia bacterium]